MLKIFSKNKRFLLSKEDFKDFNELIYILNQNNIKTNKSNWIKNLIILIKESIEIQEELQEEIKRLKKK